jgi:hypothetical protein
MQDVPLMYIMHIDIKMEGVGIARGDGLDGWDSILGGDDIE